jgi:hypothetical protein
MPCEAEKTSRDPGLASLRFDLAIASLVTGLDKSQVFAFVLNGEKFAKAPPGSIRRKFSIDGKRAIINVRPVHPRFRNHTGAGFETRRSPFAPNAASLECKPACRARCSGTAARALSVRLSSL